MTDRGSEFLGGPLENLCESYGIEIENLPAYRPDLKGIVEKLFDLIQCAYKPLLKGKGVVESDIQERGAPDYRRQGALDLEQFSAVVLRCVLYYNSQYIQSGFSALPVWQVLASCPPLLLFGRSVQRKTIARCPLPVPQSYFMPCSPARTENHTARIGTFQFEIFKLHFQKALRSRRDEWPGACQSRI